MEDADKIVVDENYTETSGYTEVDAEQDSLGEDSTVPIQNNTISKEREVLKQVSIPPPGPGQRIYEIDPLLSGHREHLDYR